MYLIKRKNINDYIERLEKIKKMSIKYYSDDELDRSIKNLIGFMENLCIGMGVSIPRKVRIIKSKIYKKHNRIEMERYFKDLILEIDKICYGLRKLKIS